MRKMNNKGQVMVIFCILIPFIILFLYIFIVKSYLIYQKTRIENVLSIACKSNNVENSIKLNDKDIEFNIESKNDKIIIFAEKKFDNFINILGKTNKVKVIKRCD